MARFAWLGGLSAGRRRGRQSIVRPLSLSRIDDSESIRNAAAAAAAAVEHVRESVGVVRSIPYVYWIVPPVLSMLLSLQVVLFFQPLAGVYFNAGALAALVGLSLWRQAVRPLAVTLALLPLCQLVMMSLPTLVPLARLTLFESLLLVLAYVYRYLFALDQPTTRSRLGWKGYGVALPGVIIGGQLAGLLGYGLLHGHYQFQASPLWLVYPAALFFAFAEETFFRGLLQREAARLMPAWLAAGFGTVLSAAFMVGHGAGWVPLVGLVGGGLAAAVYVWRQNVLLCVVLNATVKLTYLTLMVAFTFH